jgi:succinyl-CoA synthetase beta subunit
VATTPEQARDIAAEYGKMVVVKSQVLVGGRGKAGGVKLANTPEEAFEKAQAILGMLIKGLTVEKVLVTEAVDIASEYYLGVTHDRDRRKVVLIASAAGGVDIEQVAEETPEKIVKIWADPHRRLEEYEIRKALFKGGFDASIVGKCAWILKRLHQAFFDYDCSLVEINPMVVTTDGKVSCVDAKMNFDSNALFRHPQLKTFSETDAEDPLELEAAKRKIAYVRLTDGYVGVIGNGAGLVMGTMDEVKRAGGKPANFLDVGGGASADEVFQSVDLVLMDPNVRGVLINIFGGITQCPEVANGVIQAFSKLEVKVPVVLRLSGTQEEEGRKLIADAQTDLITATTLPEGAAKIVELCGKE